MQTLDSIGEAIITSTPTSVIDYLNHACRAPSQCRAAKARTFVRGIGEFVDEGDRRP